MESGLHVIETIQRDSSLPTNDISIVSAKVFYSAPVAERSIVITLTVYMCVYLSASISLKPLDRFSPNFYCMSPAVVARSSSGGFAIRYVLPVLWMTSRLAVMGRMTYFNSGAEFDVYEYLVFIADRH